MLFEVLKYNLCYEDELMNLIQEEGEDWSIYWKEPNASKYRESLEQSITYIALADGKVCGYSRSLKDSLFVYVCDLLVSGMYRGNGLGRKLLECVQKEYTDHVIYVMSGNDEYYEKIRCEKEGSIFLFQ